MNDFEYTTLVYNIKVNGTAELLAATIRRVVYTQTSGTTIPLGRYLELKPIIQEAVITLDGEYGTDSHILSKIAIGDWVAVFHILYRETITNN